MESPTSKPESQAQFGMGHCNYLGNTVGGGLVKPTIKYWCHIDLPSSRAEEASFNISGSYWVNSSQITVAVTNLISKKLPKHVVWSAKCAVAFKHLKQLQCSDPVLEVQISRCSSLFRLMPWNIELESCKHSWMTMEKKCNELLQPEINSGIHAFGV